MDKVYIVTVCWNPGQLLEPTIQSVISQDYPNMDYIVIDGGSTDGTKEIIKKYNSNIFHWISEPDNGIYDAMNKALKIVRDLKDEKERCWVNFMNAGDSFASNNVLSHIFNSPIKEHVKIIGGNTNIIHNSFNEQLPSLKTNMIPYALPFCHQSCFVAICKDYNWTFDVKYKIAADYKVIYDTYYKYGEDSIIIYPLTISNYRYEGSTTFSNMNITEKEYLKIRSRHINIRYICDILRYLKKDIKRLFKTNNTLTSSMFIC